MDTCSGSDPSRRKVNPLGRGSTCTAVLGTGAGERMEARELMKVISLNVGLPREVDWHGRAVRTSIRKSPVEGRVRVMGFNLDGDRQSDLTVHGGERKAVDIYPSDGGLI